MELLSKVGRYEFLSEPFHCDYSSHLFMGHLGNHLLNAADFHSNDRGYGMNYLMPRHRTWVLSRLAIEMTEMPKSYDKFAVETWVENAMKYFTARDFKICGTSPAGEEEKVYGYGKSVWAMKIGSIQQMIAQMPHKQVTGIVTMKRFRKELISSYFA